MTFPHVPDDAREQAQYAPRPLELREGAQTILGCVEETRVKGEGLFDTLRVLFCASTWRHEARVFLGHTRIERAIGRGGRGTSARVNALEEPAGNDLGRLGSDRVEVCGLA